MAEFRKRTWVRRLIYSPAAFAVFLLILLYAGYAAWNAWETYSETRRGTAVALRDYESLKAREERIKRDLARLETTEGVEEEIRNKFGFVKEGEGVVRIIEPPVQFPGTDNSEEGGFWGRVWNALVSLFGGE
ncbi:MAG: septum formation initiator family protein [Patescibacteria group bacterium]